MASAKRWIASLLMVVSAGGCVEQTMTIKTDPPGSVVSLNDQILGRTPLEKDFTWYGDYQVEVRHDGYETLKTHKWVRAPWWNWVPLDLLANMVPWAVRDHQTLTFKLQPIVENVVAPGPLMDRAIEMQGQLRASQNTRNPSTRTATRPSSRPATTRAVKARM